MFPLLGSTVVLALWFGSSAVRQFEGSLVRRFERTHQEPSNPRTNEPANPRTSEPPNLQDSFWCPMHPNVRSGEATGKCSECGMSLVAIPDRTGASYWLDVTTQPAAVTAGRPFRLQLAVRERATNEVVSEFEVMHERPIHLFIVSGDLRHFDHVHPTPGQDGGYEVALTLPAPGAYRLVADLLPAGGTPQTLQHTIVTGGLALPVVRPRPAPTSEVLESVDGGVRARLLPENARSGDDTHLILELVDEKSGAPLTDVEPYLGAWGHVFLASHDLTDVVHSHPLLEATTPGGPTITFHTLLARSGWYRAWAQVQRRGRLLTFGFTIRVAPPL